MWWLVILGVFALYLAIVLAAALRKQREFCSPQHIVELAERLATVRGEALAGVDSPVDPAAMENDELPPGATVTSAGIALLYTIDREDDDYVHHVSMSYRGGWFPCRAARVLLVYVRRLLQLQSPPAVQLTDGGRYHFEFRLDEAEQQAFAGGEIEIPSPDAAAETIAECRWAAAGVAIETISITPPPPAGEENTPAV